MTMQQAGMNQVNDFQVQLKALENSVAELCMARCGLDEFYRQLLDLTVRVLGVGGGILEAKDAGEFSLAAHVNLNLAGLECDGSQPNLTEIALRRVMESKQAVILTPDNASNIYDGGLSSQIHNKSDHTLLYLPIIVEGKVESVFLLIAPKGVDARAIRGLSGFLANLCNQSAVFVLRAKLLSQQGQIERADRLRQYVSAVHSSLDPRRAGYALANYAQELLGVYRCMAGTFTSRGKFTLQSVSGLESVAVKSAFIKNIVIIAREVCRNNKPLIVDNPNIALQAGGLQESDELTAAARLFMLEAKSLILGIFPVQHEGHVVGALVVEKAIEEPFSKPQRQQIDALLVEAGAAFANCLAYRTMPLALPSRAVAKLRDTFYRTAAAKRTAWLVLLALVLVLPVVIHRPVKVRGAAELAAVDARTVYAQVDGRIESVAIPADRAVTAGDILAWLDTRTIDRDIDRVSNQIAETRLALADASNRQLTTETQRYDYSLKALEAELEMYKYQRQWHAITAPVTGRIVTKEADIRKMLSRPVARGDAILEIVPETTRWEFLVSVPEDEAGNLLIAWKALAGGETLKARLILKSRPDMTFETTVVSVSPRAHVQTTGQQKYRNVITVRLAQPVNLFEQIDPRLGLEGNAAIQCLDKPLYYILTHEFVDFVRVSLF